MMTYMSVSVLMIDLGNLRYAAKYFPALRFRPPVRCVGVVCLKIGEDLILMVETYYA